LGTIWIGRKAYDQAHAQFNHLLTIDPALPAREWAGRRVPDLLVVCEMALALVLLAGTGLLVNSFQRLRAIDPGFNPDKVLTCQVALPSSKYKDPQIVFFFQRLLERVRALPGVKAAGATMTLPFSGGYWSGLNIDGRPVASRESIPIVSFVQVDPRLFSRDGLPPEGPRPQRSG